MEYERDQILRDYFRYLDERTDELYDVVEEVDEFARRSPIEAWPLVVASRSRKTMARIIAIDAAVDKKVKEALAYAILGEPSQAVCASLSEWLLRSPCA